MPRPRADRRAYLHIGAPKAGSTSIQDFLAARRKALLALDLEVCDFGHGDVITGPLALSGALSRERDPAEPRTEPWMWLDRRLAETPHEVCISREGLCGHLKDRDQLAFTLDFFGRRGFQPKLIAYVRDHVGYLNADYAQQAKKLRLTEEFDVWAGKVLADPPNRYSYWRMFRRMLTIDGLEVTITPLNDVSGGRLIPHFCAEIDRPDVDLSGLDRAPSNASPGARTIAASLVVGRALAERGIDPEEQPHLARIFRELTDARGWSEEPFFGPDETTAQRLEAAYARSDERLARRLWNTSWTDRVPPTRKSQNVFPLASASAAERAEMDEVARAIVDRATRKPSWRRIFARR
jgi:hypothetical protein